MQSNRPAPADRRFVSKAVEREIDEQILPDGGHFERSPMYHALLLEGLLDLHNVHRTFDTLIPSPWIESAREMLGWLPRMCHGDDGIAFFNDPLTFTPAI